MLGAQLFYFPNLQPRASSQLCPAARAKLFEALYRQNWQQSKLSQKADTARSGDQIRDLAAAILQRGYSADAFPFLAKALRQAEADTAMVIVALITKSLTISPTLRRTAALWVYQGGSIKLERGGFATWNRERASFQVRGQNNLMTK